MNRDREKSSSTSQGCPGCLLESSLSYKTQLQSESEESPEEEELHPLSPDSQSPSLSPLLESEESLPFSPSSPSSFSPDPHEACEFPPSSLWRFGLWSLPPGLLSKPFLQTPWWQALQLCLSDLRVWASPHAPVFMLGMCDLSVRSIFFRRQALEPVIQIHPVLFLQLLSLLLIKLLLVLGDSLPASANLHHALPQGHIFQVPIWP